jgi:hypothetical protein
MKNEGIRAAIGMFVFSAILLAISCISDNKNASNSSNSSNSDVTVAAANCSNLQTAINQILQDSELQPQHDAGNFDIVSSANSGPTELTIKGSARGNLKFKFMMDRLVPFVRKGCVQGIKFESASATSLAGGFTYCESPCYASNGACVCVEMAGTNSNNAQNANVNSNNKNSNSDFNTNKNSSSNNNLNSNSNRPSP